MKNLLVSLDSKSTPLYGRLISDTTAGKLTIAGTIYNTVVPEEAQIVICAASATYMISGHTFAIQTTPGGDLPNGVLLNPGSIWLEGTTTLYYGSPDQTYINLEFYRILG
jgi:hypothetical protein